MKITPDVFDAYLKCPTKCWLRSRGESPSGCTYPEWVKAQSQSYRMSETERLIAASPHDQVVHSPDAGNLKVAKWRLAANVPMQVKMDFCILESELHAVERLPAESRGKPAQFIPIRFVFSNKLSKDDKMLLAFDAFALARSLRRQVTHGRIIHGDNHTTSKIKTTPVDNEVRKKIERIAVLAVLTSVRPASAVSIWNGFPS
jgi:hypothetical protein